MKRRNFLKSGSVAAVAVTLPVSSLLAQEGCVMSRYAFSNIEGDFQYFWSLGLCHATISKLSGSAEADRKLEVTITKKANPGVDVIGKYVADYKIISSDTQEKDIFKVSAQLSAEKPDPNIPALDLKIFPVDFKKLNLNVQIFSTSTYNFIHVLDNNNKTYATLTPPRGCFLTTACVQTLGKPDNCEELTMLRDFRDKILVNIDEGRELIAEYYAIAPEIVKSINSQSAKNDIYLSIYDRMIIPVIESIQHTDYARAVDIYRSRTLELKARYVLPV